MGQVLSVPSSGRHDHQEDRGTEADVGVGR